MSARPAKTGKLSTEEKSLLRFYLKLLGAEHGPVLGHSWRVARLATRVARDLSKDGKAVFLAAAFHDLGKLVLPSELFSGRNITEAEFARVKTHARLSHSILRDRFLFTALCCGLHHAMSLKGGYGISVKDFPEELSPATVKKVLEVATLVSVCDFADAHNTRKTALRSYCPAGARSLRELLTERFPDDSSTVNAVLRRL